MLKIRIQGTTNDIKWFLKILERDKRFKTNEPSRPLDIKGSEKYKRVFTEIFKDESEYLEHKRKNEARTRSQYFGSGMSFGYVKSPRDKYKKKTAERQVNEYV